jgi:predicted nucleotidyltransferase
VEGERKMYKSNLEVIKRVIEHKNKMEDLGHDYFFVALQGSWNYGLGYEGSDVDTKGLVLPNFRDIVLNKEPISTTHIMENNEHLDLKDIRVMFKNFWKQNINFLEILFTDFVYINPEYWDQFEALTDMAEDIAHYDEKRALNCMCGMAQEKYHALEHPYPAVVDKIEKFGYDGKQLHHIMRMADFMSAYISGTEFRKCLFSFEVYSKEDLMKAKRNEFSLDDARKMSKEICDELHDMKEHYFAHNELTVYDDVKRAADEVVYDVLKKKFRKDLL